MGETLADRLVEPGVDPHRIADPHDAWLRLHVRFELRATLIDRHALEAHLRGIRPEDHTEDRRRRRALRQALTSTIPVSDSWGSRGDPVEIVEYDPSWPGASRSGAPAWGGRSVGSRSGSTMSGRRRFWAPGQSR
ncbi:MAG TPA: hypothetical protein VE173_04085 [Longimicrobiales bacterium]|nr:hypothetical protein [Longimicrobiales bacterium]